MNALMAFAEAKSFFAGQVKRIKYDESGMELVQMVLLILFAVVVALAVWYFLGDAIAGWMDHTSDSASSVNSIQSTQVYGKTSISTVN